LTAKRRSIRVYEHGRTIGNGCGSCLVARQTLPVSNVTNVIVLAGFEIEAMRPFTFDRDTWDPDVAPDRDWSGWFTNVAKGEPSDLWVNDSKGPECDVWVGAFNHLNRPALLHDLAAAPWRDPLTVQVLIKGQDDDCWGIWMFSDGDLREVALPGVVRVPLRAYVRGPWSPDRPRDPDRAAEVGMLERRPPLSDDEALYTGSIRLADDGWHYSLHGLRDGSLYGVVLRDEAADVEAVERLVGDVAVQRGHMSELPWKRTGRATGYDGSWFTLPR
jgi:hypothetical protein